MCLVELQTCHRRCFRQASGRTMRAHLSRAHLDARLAVQAALCQLQDATFALALERTARKYLPCTINLRLCGRQRMKSLPFASCYPTMLSRSGHPVRR